MGHHEKSWIDAFNDAEVTFYDLIDISWLLLHIFRVGNSTPSPPNCKRIPGFPCGGIPWEVGRGSQR